MPNYTEICRVTLEHAGLPVKLLLQQVTNNGPFDYRCLSWRTDLLKGPNRQYYYLLETGAWKVPVQIASNLLNQAYKRGWLDEAFDDPQRRHGGSENTVIDSRHLESEAYERKLASIIKSDWENRKDDWGSKPVFVIIQVPDRTWRKIMIVDTNREMCTFRSTTTDHSYGKRVARGMVHPWGMDNSMQDASSAMMRIFRQVLLEVTG